MNPNGYRDGSGAAMFLLEVMKAQDEGMTAEQFADDYMLRHWGIPKPAPSEEQGA